MLSKYSRIGEAFSGIICFKYSIPSATSLTGKKSNAITVDEIAKTLCIIYNCFLIPMIVCVYMFIDKDDKNSHSFQGVQQSPIKLN